MAVTVVRQSSRIFSDLRESSLACSFGIAVVMAVTFPQASNLISALQCHKGIGRSSISGCMVPFRATFQNFPTKANWKEEVSFSLHFLTVKDLEIVLAPTPNLDCPNA